MPKIDIMGRRFGKLVVIGEEPPIRKNIMRVCQCDCGAVITTPTVYLTSGGKTSCGCDTFQKRSNVHGKHCMSKTPTYNSWAAMKARCLNPLEPDYDYYGGRGITICQEWVDSFEAFLEDMGVRPDGLTLDRKDSNLGYSKDNCRWVSRAQQANNKRTTIYLTYKSLTTSLKAWSEILQVTRRTLYTALRRGETIEEFINKRNLDQLVIEYQTGGTL